MSKLEIRKIVIEIDETHRDFNIQLKNPTIKAVSAAVIKNIFANKYIKNLEPLYDIGAEVGGLLAEKCVSTLNVKPEEIESYGKGAIIGAGSVVVKNVKSNDIVAGVPALSIKN